MPKSDARAVLAHRLRAVRTAMEFSQAELGVRMGLPEDVASTRINRYEKGVHLPDIETAERMAKELGVPLAYLVTQNERLASAILMFSELTEGEQDKFLNELKALSRKTKHRK